MRTLKLVRKRIENQPNNPAAEIFSRLVLALESQTPFQLADLYQLDFDDFGLALDLLSEWRLDRYYASKGRLLDLSMQHADLQAQSETSPFTEAGAKKIA